MMRTITSIEYNFLLRVEKATGRSLEAVGLTPTICVEEMSDGGMGSLRFPSDTGPDVERRLGEVLAQGEFADEDGVPVSFTINLDSKGRLFELDVWRVDFEPLKRFPNESDEVKMQAETA
jgi:hypothetical protein